LYSRVGPSTYRSTLLCRTWDISLITRFFAIPSLINHPNLVRFKIIEKLTNFRSVFIDRLPF
jgi:hypothetical protein